ncbi:MAG: ribonuclease III [Candidatus Komeilibacteria bacterium CG10_big_fil_rev_8_21_14_0_10_41_13]|uniref:Ribonuclease 3 n=1 Tax=Candidatus Komeilibacteria bacterium CG10_big_fil_rev_8_21_14_0_10_41_13 TaxID=1974476 RepID=A0A2M6WBM9_9BACT|nr:MAG: ribonuclease III [Candidatus Komeilibacteria bacterium CG10_big_fil_rev_8_21_14_0_10_41_13]
MKDLKKLEKQLGVEFNNKDFIRTALVHRSYLNEHKSFELDHNERLEFLGDAVLEVVVTEYLYLNYPNPEGELTNWRASLVNAKMLAEVARALSIEDYLQMSKGEAKDTNPKARNYILANAMEAVIGAIYLDQGIEAASDFISRNILSHLPHILENELYLDPKSKFQEKSQEHFGITPSYKVLEEDGPDHSKYFKVGVYLDNELVAEGHGTSKQEAQVKAAAKGIEAKGW